MAESTAVAPHERTLPHNLDAERSVLGAVLREVIVSEAMHALGIPTTRALAAATTGEQIVREGAMPGAVLTRVASSHLRVGTFEFFAARGMHDEVRRLLDYAVARHDRDLIDDPERARKLLARVVERQAVDAHRRQHVHRRVAVAVAPVVGSQRLFGAVHRERQDRHLDLAVDAA